MTKDAMFWAVAIGGFFVGRRTSILARAVPPMAAAVVVQQPAAAVVEAPAVGAVIAGDRERIAEALR